jgi:hypothetical protein
MNKTIAFHGNQLCLRGTTSAIYAYADYNERILGNKSIIVSSPNGDLTALEKFQKRFKEVHLIHFGSYISLFRQQNVDYLYAIKGGNSSDGVCMLEVPTLVHAVFCENDPHGHRYCYVSDWLAKNQGYDPNRYAVPHIAEKLPAPSWDYREKLGISKSKTVFGCYAGVTEFNINDVHYVIDQIVKERDDIIFLFMNINKFCDDHPNIIHLNGTWDLNEKSAFVNACDAMLHARRHGETFGCAVAEFTMENKPVITYKHSAERSHIEILGDRAIYYGDGREEIYNILTDFKSYVKYDDYYKAYENHSPEIIMERFDKNFLD